MSAHIEMFDTVVVISNITALDLRAGEVGVVFGISPWDGTFMIEFCDDTAVCYGTHSLRAEQFLVLHTRGKALRSGIPGGFVFMKCRHCGSPWEYVWEFCPQCRRNYGGARYPSTQTDEELRDIQSLIQQIHEAFAEVAIGGGETLHQAHLEGAYTDKAEWLAAREMDPESHWSEVPDSKLESISSALSFIDPEGWRFYIPAYMCWTLQNWRTTGKIAADQVIWNLEYADERATKRYDLLSRVQSEAVYDFLEFFVKYSGVDDAGNAIRLYWHRFRKS